jgi:hypothetical protein
MLPQQRFKLRAAVAQARRRPDAAPRRSEERASGFEQALDSPPADRLVVVVADAQATERDALEPGDELAVDLPGVGQKLLDTAS